MIGAERVHDVKHAPRGIISQRFGCAALSFHGVSRRLAVHQREPAVFVYAETGDRIVTAIGREQKPPIRRQDDATCAFKSVRRAFLPADRPESPGPGTARGATFYLRKRAARRPTIVHDTVLDLVRLHVEVSAMPI